MVNSPRSFAPSPPIHLDSAATELKALFEETRSLDFPLSSPLASTGTVHSEAGVITPGLSAMPTEGSAPRSRGLKGIILAAHPLARRGVGVALGAGAILLTMMGGVLSGAMVAQLYPQWSEGILGQSLSGGSASPVLEQFFQGVEHQRPRLAVQVYDWFNGPSALEPSRLAQWQPGELEAEIDRLLAASQTLETEVANLEQQLGLQAQAQGAALSGRLLALRQAVESPSGSILPLQMTLPADLLFEDGKTNLKADAQDLLNNLEKSLRSELNLPQGTRLNLTIATHTDSVGNAAHNLDLSLQRSRSLQNYLSQRLNSPALTWIPVGYGSTRPLADNSTESNRQRNRRVEMTLDW